MSECQYCKMSINGPGGSLPNHERTCIYRPDLLDESGNFGEKSIFTKNGTKDRRLLKKKIVEHKLIEYKCQGCGNEGHWMGKPLTLVLDHINGVNNDNRLSNLRFMCSNCDSQLDTYKSRNRK